MLEPTDIDETYVGGLETIKHASKKTKGTEVKKSTETVKAKEFNKIVQKTVKKE